MPLTDNCFKRSVILSINPEYVHKILAGKKNVELRRRFPINLSNNTRVYIYATSPAKEISGMATIFSVEKLPLETIWANYQARASIERSLFDNYFSGLSEGYALLLKDVKAFNEPIQLKELQTKLNFIPPQSFLYAKNDLEKIIGNEEAIISN